MNNKWFCKMVLQLNPHSNPRKLAGVRLRFGLFLVHVVFSCASHALGGAPDWLRAATQSPLPRYPEDTNAVVLLDDQSTVISDSGEIKTVYRRAYKILRSEGRHHGVVAVYFDNETQLTRLKAWSIAAGGKDYEVKEKDAVETSAFNESLYQDTRHKVLVIPAAEPGSVVAYEYEQKRRSRILQDTWRFQDDIPVHRARFTLRLPRGWEYRAHWSNYPEWQPRSAGENQLVWELEEVPAILEEPSMPPPRAIEGWLGVTYYPRQTPAADQPAASWQSVGLWFAELAADRRRSSTEIHQKTQELVSGAATPLAKIDALAAFVQQQIRYVAIEIGIGGYQPHAARDVFVNRYGDCKDKATLLSTMLEEIGIKSDYVLVNAARGVVIPQFPSMLSFNHVILAIHLPADIPASGLWSVHVDDRLGRVLYFDPTDPYVPLGYLPDQLQASYGLLIAQGGGQLQQLPLMPPPSNRLLRAAKLVLTSDGTLYGNVTEFRSGEPAAAMRAQLLRTSESERKQVQEKFLGSFLAGCVLKDFHVDNLEQLNEGLVARYSFVAAGYAKSAGDLLLLRPRVLGSKAQDGLELAAGKPRKYPVAYRVTTSQGDVVEIVLPDEYKVDELPAPLAIDTGIAQYSSRSEVTGNLLRYTRNYEIKKILVPADSVDQLKEFFRQITADERGSVVLKRSIQ
jgi:transglutaminase-like putative cysteine protease